MARSGSFNFHMGKRALTCHGVLLLGYPLDRGKKIGGLKLSKLSCGHRSGGFNYGRVKRDLSLLCNWRMPFFPEVPVGRNREQVKGDGSDVDGLPQRVPLVVLQNQECSPPEFRVARNDPPFLGYESRAQFLRHGIDQRLSRGVVANIQAACFRDTNRYFHPQSGLKELDCEVQLLGVDRRGRFERGGFRPGRLGSIRHATYVTRFSTSAIARAPRLRL